MAGFGLPPGVHDGELVFADDLSVPHPGFWVDGFSHGTEESKGGEVAVIGVLVSPFHEGADGGGCGIEDGDFMFFDDAPEAVSVGCVWSAFIDHDGSAVGEGSVDDVGVSGDPPDIGGTPEDVVFFEVEDEFCGGIDAGEVAGGGMEDAFRFAGGP